MTPDQKLADLKRRVDADENDALNAVSNYDETGTCAVDGHLLCRMIDYLRTLSRLIERMPDKLPENLLNDPAYDTGNIDDMADLECKHEGHNALRQTIIDIITEEV